MGRAGPRFLRLHSHCARQRCRLPALDPRSTGHFLRHSRQTGCLPLQRTGRTVSGHAVLWVAVSPRLQLGNWSPWHGAAELPDGSHHSPSTEAGARSWERHGGRPAVDPKMGGPFGPTPLEGAALSGCSGARPGSSSAQCSRVGVPGGTMERQAPSPCQVRDMRCLRAVRQACTRRHGNGLASQHALPGRPLRSATL